MAQSFMPQEQRPKTNDFMRLRNQRAQRQNADAPGGKVQSPIVPTFVENPSNSAGGFDEVNQIHTSQRPGGFGALPSPRPLNIQYGGANTTSGGGGSSSGGGVSHSGGSLVQIGNYKFSSSIADKVHGLLGLGGLSLSSGYRDPAHNARVGGVSNSNHLTGRAVDMSGSSSAMARGAAWARANGAREVLIHNAGSGQHLHAAW